MGEISIRLQNRYPPGYPSTQEISRDDRSQANEVFMIVFNMCLGEKYCVKCGKKEYYNVNDPYHVPSKCKCGGRLTDKATEEFMKTLAEDEYIKEYERNLSKTFK